jgi:hypothetical protein
MAVIYGVFQSFILSMNISDLAKIVVSVLVSLGGGGAIVVGLSSWLGKIWAERLMERERKGSLSVRA